jgi:hypothetical protein
MRVGRLLGVFAFLIISTAASPAVARASAGGGTTIGPVEISALGHPGLCWEAGGNGSAVTLEHCDRLLQGQQWSLTPGGVVLNGNGYCLEAVPGDPLYIDFAAQCAGIPSQRWHYRSGQLASPVPATGSVAAPGASTGTCAAIAGPVVPGAEVTGGACSRRDTAPGRADTVSRWSIGYSAVTLTPGRGRGPAGGTFGASVTVANAASAQAAYGVSVTFTLPPGVTAAGLRAPGLHCQVGPLACTGTLPAGTARRITLTGPVPAAVRPGDSYPVRARVSVTGTTQRSRTARTTAALAVTVTPAAAPPPRSPLPLIAAAAAVLLLAGTALTLLTRRRSPARPRTWRTVR